MIMYERQVGKLQGDNTDGSQVIKKSPLLAQQRGLLEEWILLLKFNLFPGMLVPAHIVVCFYP